MLRRSLITRALSAVVMPVALVAGIGGSLTQATPAAADNADPAAYSQRVVVNCKGAGAEITVRWWSSDKATIRWRAWDSAADGKTPIMQIVARNNYNPDRPKKWSNGTTWLHVKGGNGAEVKGGLLSWDPSTFGRMLNLKFTVHNGLTSEGGASCGATKTVWNWSQNAYRIAKQKDGAPYRLGGEGPSSFDCSGLVLYAYENLGTPGAKTFPDFENSLGIRTAYDEYLKFKSWAEDGSTSKFDAVKVAKGSLQRGDLVFYNFSGGRPIDHVAFFTESNGLYDGYQPGTPIGHHAFWNDGYVQAFRIVGVS